MTSARSRTFTTPVGVFGFTRVPAARPRASVRAEKIDSQSWAFVASPERAIADLIYARKDVTWEQDGPAFLTDSMRIARYDLDALSRDTLNEVGDRLRDRRTVSYLRGLLLELRK